MFVEWVGRLSVAKLKWDLVEQPVPTSETDKEFGPNPGTTADSKPPCKPAKPFSVSGKSGPWRWTTLSSNQNLKL